MASLSTALEVSLVGLAVVFGALILIGTVIGLLGRLGASQQTEPEHSDGVPAEIIAAISAAVTVACGGRVRIRRVRYAVTEEETWSRQGRIIVMASHQTRE